MRISFKILGLVLMLIFANGCRKTVSKKQDGDSLHKTTDKPNVLFISIDDMNDWIEPYNGHPQTITPSMKALSERSYIFTNAHAAAPLCNPSRVALLTGIDPRHSGIISNNAFYPFRDHLPKAETLLDRFNEKGYITAVWGKIYHKKDGEKEDLDIYRYDYGRPKTAPENPKNELPELTEKVYKYFDWGAYPDSVGTWGEHQSANHAIAFLNEKHNKPFFAAIGMRLPHLPWNVPDEFMTPFDSLDIKVPPYLKNDYVDIPDFILNYRPKTQIGHRIILNKNKQQEAVKAYLAAIHYSDYEVGRILDALESSKYSNNTIIILWSDHGFHLGEKDWWRKNTLWERSTRVPLMIALPKQKQKTEITQPTSLIDLFPTLLALCNISSKGKTDGINLKTVFENTKTKLQRDFVATTNEAGTALRDNEWRYIRYIDGSEELYHTTQDPNEFKNLINDIYAKEKLQEMRNRWYGVKTKKNDK